LPASFSRSPSYERDLLIQEWTHRTGERMATSAGEGVFRAGDKLEAGEGVFRGQCEGLGEKRLFL